MLTLFIIQFQFNACPKPPGAVGIEQCWPTSHDVAHLPLKTIVYLFILCLAYLFYSLMINGYFLWTLLGCEWEHRLLSKYFIKCEILFHTQTFVNIDLTRSLLTFK